MLRPAVKVFTTGSSQAVRLPKAFRVNTREMWVTKNEVTGEMFCGPRTTTSAGAILKRCSR